ncbi:hypothetical protein RHGRI_008017 [Rhododendron griersonianum]|uniref:Protein yippee-like n=1 Tax=Rhododendron griersonianum TaxID=479676 RepID=A0AAV6KZ24_9ERIC|nr:hypothetical protein RHGRI_008017 [Rhododendron griersonianum]
MMFLSSLLYSSHTIVNVTVGEIEERMMMTGMHAVCDIFCVGCGSILGWKYETAHEKSQKYKEGKSVLERLVVELFQTVENTFKNSNEEFKISGPDESRYWVGHETPIGSSDADDV